MLADISVTFLYSLVILFLGRYFYGQFLDRADVWPPNNSGSLISGEECLERDSNTNNNDDDENNKNNRIYIKYDMNIAPSVIALPLILPPL